MTPSKNLLQRVNNYVEIARALKGDHQTGQFFHVTFLCRKRKILCIGWNDYMRLCPEHRFGVYEPTKTSMEGAYRPGIHSELSVLIRSGLEDCTGLDFFNIRIGNNGQIGSSKPCKNCQRVLNQVGFKHIYYFDQGQLKIL